MARRKPAQVVRHQQQLKRQREQEDDAQAAAEDEDQVAIEDGDEQQVAGADEYEEMDRQSAGKPKKKAKKGRATGSMMRARCGSQSVSTPQLLSFSEVWTQPYREQALWLEVPVYLGPDASDAFRQALLSFREHFRVGIELQPNDTVVLRAFPISDQSSAYQPPMDEAAVTMINCTMEHVFMGTDQSFPLWHVLSLLKHDLVTMEVWPKTQEDLGIDSMDEEPAFVWKIGIAWHHYMDLCTDDPLLAPSPKKGLPKDMHILMIWILHNANPCQWIYPYEKEIKVLYTQLLLKKVLVDGERTTFDVHKIYDEIDTAYQLKRDISNYLDVSANDTNLLPMLRPYQMAAVSWMLARESPVESAPKSTKPFVKFSTPVWTVDYELLYDPFCVRFFSSNKEQLGTELDPDTEPEVIESYSDFAVRGGILADEMGLGKTVEVIALILSNSCPSNKPQLLTDHTPNHRTEEEDDGFDENTDFNCICGTILDHELGWVQCDFCDSWHHQVCSGYNSLDAFSTANENGGKYSHELFMCFNCQHQEKPVFSCKTTLIVSPESIHDQWESELTRHVKPGVLTLLRYPGVKALRTRLAGRGPCADWSLLASAGRRMASYDIVLTTYEALGIDLHHLPNEVGLDRRSSTRQKKKRYAFVASPLVSLKFWRVCMDEAQVGVENTRLQAALTVAELKTEMKWIVTGTPFSAQLGDLYGCFKFLQLAPFNDEYFGDKYFRSIIENCFTNGAVERVYDILLRNGDLERNGGGLLWRTSKKDVLDQLNLPSQKSETVLCHFSDVERHFYEEQMKVIVNLMNQRREQAKNGPDRDRQLRTDDRLWNDVLILRQICCHPQVGSALNSVILGRGRAVGGGVNSRNGILTMDDLLQELIAKCKRECEEGQRKLVAAHNGIASISIIRGDVPSAVLKYLLSMKEINSNWGLFRADLLPRLHILVNLRLCVCRMYFSENLPNRNEATATVDDLNIVHQEMAQLENKMTNESNDAKANSLLPHIPAIFGAFTAETVSTDVDGEIRKVIQKECEMLDQCANKIKQYYLFQVEMSHASALKCFEDVSASLDKQLPSGNQKHLLCDKSIWWNKVLPFINQAATDEGFIDRIRARLLGAGTKWAQSFVGRFSNTNGFMMALVTELESLRKNRAMVYEKVKTLSHKTPTPNDIALSGNCKRCREGRDGPVCAHCKLYKELEGFKLHFLGIEHSASAMKANANASTMYTEDEDSIASGTSMSIPSLILDLLREIATAIRSLGRSGARSAAEMLAIVQEGIQSETELWTLLQREWTAAKKLFQVQHQRLGALDELDMACMQIRLRHADEINLSKAERLYIVDEGYIPVRLNELEVDRVVGKHELDQGYARLRYLRQLESQRGTTPNASELPAHNAQESKATCAVCLEEMGVERAVLPCAHAFCKACTKTLSKHRKKNKLLCPTCRQSCSVDSILTVCEGNSNNQDGLSNSNRVLPQRALVQAPQTRGGGYGSKIGAILQRVLSLAEENAEVKCLLFTQWQDMMNIISMALARHGVTCLVYTTKKRFPDVLQQFKRFTSPCVLALPYKVGANGLNVIEATEVILVEPLLNAGIEAQAINRVHRIGQTKQTRVHRFVVENTVEERMFSLRKSKVAAAKTPAVSADRNEGVEGTDHIEDDEEKEVRAPGKNEKESLTLNDLSMLLLGSGEVAASAIVAINDNDADNEENDDSNARFWIENVELNGRILPRQAARIFLERRHAASLREASSQDLAGASVPPTSTSLFGQQINLSVARELLELQRPSTSCSDRQQMQHAISDEVLALHRTRLQADGHH